MAEGWANDLGATSIEARSAGIEAHGKNPRAIAIMREAGVDISQQESKTVTRGLLDWADRVVTVCGHANEHCPALPPGTQQEHWPLEDPAKAIGTEEQIIDVFRATRDDIRRRVQEMIGHLKFD